MYAKLTSVTYTDLLEDHAPRLIYDSQEDYRADAWQTATDLPAARLMWRIGDSPDEGVIAARTNDPGQPQLTESWLVPEFAAYPEPPFVAMDNQYLDFGTHRESVLKDAASDLDVNDGYGDPVDLGVIDVSTMPDFLAWPGRWGASIGKTGFVLDRDSPRGPARQPSWNPVAAETHPDNKECTVE